VVPWSVVQVELPLVGPGGHILMAASRRWRFTTSVPGQAASTARVATSTSANKHPRHPARAGHGLVEPNPVGAVGLSTACG